MNITRIFSLPACVLALAGVHSAAAGVNSWTFSGPEGGLVSAVAIHPTDSSVMLAAAGNGIYRSADSGATWTYAGEGGQTDILFDPNNSNRVFAVGGRSAIYRSDDAGVTFTITDRPPNASPYRLTISGDSVLYFADHMGHIYKSTNLGVAWTEVGHGWPLGDFKVSALSVDPEQSNVVYAAAKDLGTYKSVDGGLSWGTPLTNGPGTAAQSQVYQIVIKPGDSNRILAGTSQGVYVSINAGGSWIQQSSGPWSALAFDPDVPNNVIALSFNGGIERSVDGGFSWPGSQSGPLLHVQQSLDVAVGGSNKVILATSDGPMVSTDGGDHFALRVSGIHSEDVRATTTTTDGTVYAAFNPGPFGIYKRVGTDWQPVDNVELRSRMSAYPAIFTLAVAPSNSNRLYAVGVGDALMASGDGGATWTAPHLQFVSTGIDIQRVAFDPADPRIAYVLTRTQGLWKTENNGATFVRHSTGLPTSVYAFAVDPVNTQTLYVGAYFSGSYGVYKSTNGGLSWSPTGTLPAQGATELVIDPSNPQVVYAVLTFGIHKSIDGGVTWTQLDLGPPNSVLPRTLVIDQLSPTTLIVAGTSAGPGFSRSVDGGATWQRAPWAPVHGTLGSFDVMAFDRGFGMVLGGGIGTGMYQYQISNDLSLDVTPLAGPLALASTGTLRVPVKNLGLFDAATPRLDLTIPSNLTVTVPSICTFTAPNMRCTPPAIHSGETYELALNYTAAGAPARGAFSATIVGREYDPVSTNNAKGVDVFVAAIAELAVTSTVAASVQRDLPVTFQATVVNNGPNASATTTYTLTLPGGITVQSSTPSAGACATNAGVITCELGTLAAAASATVTVQGTATIVGSQSWASAVTGPGNDSIAANNAATSTTSITAPPTPPAPPKKGGGGRFDWIAAMLLGLLLVRRWLGEWGLPPFPR